MSNFQRGQIWLVNFDPSFGHEYKKIRPALIVQNDRYIESSNLLTVIPISSQITKRAEIGEMFFRFVALAFMASIGGDHTPGGG